MHGPISLSAPGRAHLRVAVAEGVAVEIAGQSRRQRRDSVFDLSTEQAQASGRDVNDVAVVVCSIYWIDTPLLLNVMTIFWPSERP